MEIAKSSNLNPIFPSLEYCGDNAAMIAWAGIKDLEKTFSKKDFEPQSRWPLDIKAPFMKGPGLKL